MVTEQLTNGHRVVNKQLGMVKRFKWPINGTNKFNSHQMIKTIDNIFRGMEQFNFLKPFQPRTAPFRL